MECGVTVVQLPQPSIQIAGQPHYELCIDVGHLISAYCGPD
jgi:hypothetical protein